MLVSIVTPSFNQGRFIERTIRSVLEQDYPHIEYIVMDGGSTDGTIDILKRYEDRIKWISEKDAGQADAINKGIRMAKGEIVAWLNSDDYFLPGAVRKAVGVFQKEPAVSMVYGDGYRVDEREEWQVPCNVEPFFDLWKLIHLYDYILQPATFIRRKAMLSAGLIDISFYYNLDWELWIKLAKEGRVMYISEKLASERIYPEAKTQSGGVRRWKEIIKIAKKYGNYKYPPAMFLHVPKGLLRNRRGEFSSTVRKTLSFGRWILYPLTMGRVSGFYQDGYMSRRGFLSLPVVKEAVLLRIEIAPLVSGNIKVLVNNKEKHAFVMNGGKLWIELRLDERNKNHEFLHLEFRTLSAKNIPATANYSYVRRAAFQVKDIYYVTGDGKILRGPGFPNLL